MARTSKEHEIAWCVKHLGLLPSASTEDASHALAMLHDAELIDGRFWAAIGNGADPAINTPTHDHKCPTCQTVWSHTDYCRDFPASHRCPNETCKNKEPVWETFNNKNEGNQEMISKATKEWLGNRYGLPAETSEADFRDALRKAIDENALTMSEMMTLQKGNSISTSADANDIYGNGSSDQGGVPTGSVNLKAATARYSHTKSAASHPKNGMKLHDEFGRQCMLPSEAEFAKAGALFKEFARRSGIAVVMSDHDKALVAECFEKDTWCGRFENEWRTGVEGSRVKGLIGDATSGGVELIPEWFDADLITFPLLHSEIFPLIDLRPVPRGNSVETGSVGNPTVTWGVGEATPIGLFNTDSLVGGIDVSIHPVSVALEVGRDFLSDAPAQVGQTLMDNIGQRMAAELDSVIVNGNGTSQPQGIANASGINSLNSTNNTTGPATYDDYLSLMFGIGKQYRTEAMRHCFITNDTTYQRSRNITIDTADPSTDQRPIFGMDVAKYETLQRPHKVQNNLANTVAIYGALAKYRMYRRQGMETRWVTEGSTLARSNQVLLVCRGRFGGKVVDANAFSIMEDFQS